MVRFEPAGVCSSDFSGGSQMWICKDSATIKIKKWWNSEDCSTGSTTEYTPEQYWSISGLTGIEKNVTCCTGDQCEIGLKSQYNSTSCASATNLVIDYIEIATIGACLYYPDTNTTDGNVWKSQGYTSCNDNGLILGVYSGYICDEGNLLYNTSSDNPGCDVYQHTIECTTAMDTCPGPTTTSQPTQPSTAPTPSPSPNDPVNDDGTSAIYMISLMFPTILVSIIALTVH